MSDILNKLRNAVTDPQILLKAAAEQARHNLGGYPGPIALKISQSDLSEYRHLVVSSGAMLDPSVAEGVAVIVIDDDSKSPEFVGPP